MCALLSDREQLERQRAVQGFRHLLLVFVSHSLRQHLGTGTTTLSTETGLLLLASLILLTPSIPLLPLVQIALAMLPYSLFVYNTFGKGAAAVCQRILDWRVLLGCPLVLLVMLDQVWAASPPPLLLLGCLVAVRDPGQLGLRSSIYRSLPASISPSGCCERRASSTTHWPALLASHCRSTPGSIVHLGPWGSLHRCRTSSGPNGGSRWPASSRGSEAFLTLFPYFLSFRLGRDQAAPKTFMLARSSE